MDRSRETERYVRAFLALFAWAPGYAEARAVRASLMLAEEFGLGKVDLPAEWLGSPPTPEAVDPARVPLWARPAVLRSTRRLCMEAPHRERFATLYLLEDLWKYRSPAPAQPALAVA